jgi:hypothetical protein
MLVMMAEWLAGCADYSLWFARYAGYAVCLAILTILDGSLCWMSSYGDRLVMQPGWTSWLPL